VIVCPSYRFDAHFGVVFVSRNFIESTLLIGDLVLTREASHPAGYLGKLLPIVDFFTLVRL